MEPLYRSSLAAARRLGGARSPVFCFKDAEEAVGFADARWLDLPRLSRGGSRRHRQGRIQGQGCLGCVPGRRAFSDGFSSIFRSRVFCGSFQSFSATVLPLAYGAAVAASRVPRRRPAGIPDGASQQGVQGLSNLLFSCGPLCRLGGKAVLCILVRCTRTCTSLCTGLYTVSFSII